MPPPQFSRSAGAILTAAVLIGFATPGLAGPNVKLTRPVVVELYTSQGCSSCPPADAFLAQLADRKDVLALSLPITYWDMLGWRDTLASEGNTRRQKAYAKQLGRGGVYTPQMIVDGVSDVVGSRRKAVDAAIAARVADMRSVPIDLSVDSREIRIAIGAGAKPAGQNATVWVFRILPRGTVKIGDGENEGRTVTYRNVVRGIKAIGSWKGQPVRFDLPRTGPNAQRDGVAVVVQQGGYGRIIGAAASGRPD